MTFFLSRALAWVQKLAGPGDGSAIEAEAKDFHATEKFDRYKPPCRVTEFKTPAKDWFEALWDCRLLLFCSAPELLSVRTPRNLKRIYAFRRTEETTGLCPKLPTRPLSLIYFRKWFWIRLHWDMFLYRNYPSLNDHIALHAVWLFLWSSQSQGCIMHAVARTIDASRRCDCFFK